MKWVIDVAQSKSQMQQVPDRARNKNLRALPLGHPAGKGWLTLAFRKAKPGCQPRKVLTLLPNVAKFSRSGKPKFPDLAKFSFPHQTFPVSHVESVTYYKKTKSKSKLLKLRTRISLDVKMYLLSVTIKPLLLI